MYDFFYVRMWDDSAHDYTDFFWRDDRGIGFVTEQDAIDYARRLYDAYRDFDFLEFDVWARYRGCSWQQIGGFDHDDSRRDFDYVEVF